MNTYLIFDVNYNFSAYYSKKPSILYKMFRDVFDAEEIDFDFVTRLFEQIRKEIEPGSLNRYLRNSLDNSSKYDFSDNVHIVKDSRGEIIFKLHIFKDFMLLESKSKNSKALEVLNEFYNKLFAINLDVEEYYWVRDLYNVSLV